VGTCTNTVGSFQCSCLDGFETLPSTLQPELEVYCEVDVNECDRGGCANIANSTCTNQYGSFSCTCRAGYELNTAGDACVAIDECKGSRNNCARHAHCVNTESSFSCECGAGYLTPEEVALLGNCSLAHVQGLLFRDEKLGVRIVFPSRGPGTVCVEVNECQAHACARLAQLCLDTGHAADGCGSLRWSNSSESPSLAGISSSPPRNASNGTTNGTDTSTIAAEWLQEGIFVRAPPCPAHSQCHNSVGSYQVTAPLVVTCAWRCWTLHSVSAHHFFVAFEALSYLQLSTDACTGGR
jgi:hypothetical protein